MWPSTDLKMFRNSDGLVLVKQMDRWTVCIVMVEKTDFWQHTARRQLLWIPRPQRFLCLVTNCGPSVAQDRHLRPFVSRVSISRYKLLGHERRAAGLSGRGMLRAASLSRHWS